MRAFIYTLTKEGHLRSGRVTPEYATIGTMERYYIQHLPPGRYRVFVHFNWEHRYRDADRTFDFLVGCPGNGFSKTVIQ